MASTRIVCVFSCSVVSISETPPFIMNGMYLTPSTLIWELLCGKPEKAMAPYSRTLAWRIPWMQEPGGLQSMGSLRVGHD